MVNQESILSKKSYENEIKRAYSNTNGEFLFSVIIPVYNVEEYLEETINSIIGQTIDFKKHIQIILVNDGSPDNSNLVCLRYKEMFPLNIIYVEKENGGVSSARNEGIKYATGEFVNFLDSDDIIDADALEKVYQYFSKNMNEIDVVCLPIYYFEAREGKHMLNGKFYETRIIDTKLTPTDIQLHVSSAFIKYEQAIEYKFDEKLKYGEDAKYINQIILNKGKYGVLSNTKYHYRIRKTQSSAIQMSGTSESWYNDSIIHFSKALIKISIEKWGYVPKYLQHIIMYDLQWKFRMKEISTSVINEDKQIVFIELVRDVLQYIDNDVIDYQRFINFHQKNFVFILKNMNSEKSTIKYLTLKDNLKMFINGSMVNSLKDQQVYINIVEIKKSDIFIEGMFASGFNEKDSEISLLFNGEEVKTTRVDRPLNDVKVWGITTKKIYGFKVKVDASNISGVGRIEFSINVNQVSVKLRYKLTTTATFSKRIPSFYAKDDLIIFPGKKHMNVIPNTFLNNLRKEAGMLKRLFALQKQKSGARKAIFVRLIYKLLKPFINKKVYLFMDRTDKADDNAEVLFRHAVTINDGIKKYFVVSKESSDYNRMKTYGKVLPYGSYKHKLFVLFSDKLISSHADDVIINPFKSMKIYYKDLITYDYVFLQHGVIQNDLSDWLNKYKKNIKMFVTSSLKEYESIREGSYGYSEKELVCTGIPRHDRLVTNNQKTILIMPTWRKNIATKLDKNFKRIYNDQFVKTEFFNMYNKLISDKVILNKLEQSGYKIKFVIHPALKEQTIDFKADKRVEIINPDNTSYYKLFNESSLLITDYSSVAFDFAYIKKPIIYFQFDQENFFRDHFSSGYFSYEEMGFGPVITSFNELIDEVIKTLDTDCELASKYRERIDSFFAYDDQNNSKRVYSEIKKLN